MRRHAHGAVFAEVKVDPELGQVRRSPISDRVERVSDASAKLSFCGLRV
jgi:hypothetical protein